MDWTKIKQNGVSSKAAEASSIKTKHNSHYSSDALQQYIGIDARLWSDGMYLIWANLIAYK